MSDGKGGNTLNQWHDDLFAEFYRLVYPFGVDAAMAAGPLAVTIRCEMRAGGRVLRTHLEFKRDELLRRDERYGRSLARLWADTVLSALLDQIHDQTADLGNSEAGAPRRV